MLKTMMKLVFFLGMVFLITGCTTQPTTLSTAVINNNNTDKSNDNYDSYDKLITNLANQLQSNNALKNKPLGQIAITSFVDLHKLNKTSHFGRSLAEGMFNELHTRGMKVTEFRTQQSLIINAQGEYFLSRDYKKLKIAFVNKYVLVGTYSYFGKGYVVNARIIDNETGIVLATARSIYNNSDCKLAEMCEDTKPKTDNIVKVRTIKITTDNCSTVTCPTNCTSRLCNK